MEKTDLEKIEAWVKNNCELPRNIVATSKLLDYLQTLKAEKPQPDAGAMAWEALTIYAKHDGYALIDAVMEVEVKYATKQE